MTAGRLAFSPADDWIVGVAVVSCRLMEFAVRRTWSASRRVLDCSAKNPR